MLYTRKGDKGKTQIFGCNQKLSKSSVIAEALGTLDEANSFLGVIKSKISNQGQSLDPQKGLSLVTIIHNVQENLFIIQAEVAGADKKIIEAKVLDLEKIINQIEKELPPIKSFFISGASEVSALFDFARTLVRRAERRVVQVAEEGVVKVGPETLAYLNRLSSLLYALARLSAHKSGFREAIPRYK